jgi:protein-L-isoaspartate(D-aspartate) O-methyltransferase
MATRNIILGIILLFGYAVAMPTVADAKNSETDFARQRRQMVTSQLRGRDITEEAVLRAMATVPRHLFVPSKIRSLAYEDSPLPIGHDQTISQPYIVALMSQLLSLDSGDKVLEIGTGSGYQAAVLAEMDAEVYSVEIVPELARRAEKLLDELSYDRVTVKTGDGYKGWSEHAPFDGIIVTCAPTSIPVPLEEQLAEGGRMVIPAGEKYAQKLYLLTKKNGKIVQRKIIDVRFVPMVDGEGETY